MSKGICVICGERLHATPVLNIYTRKGAVHVGCATERRPEKPRSAA